MSVINITAHMLHLFFLFQLCVPLHFSISGGIGCKIHVVVYRLHLPPILSQLVMVDIPHLHVVVAAYILLNG